MRSVASALPCTNIFLRSSTRVPLALRASANASQSHTCEFFIRTVCHWNGRSESSHSPGLENNATNAHSKLRVADCTDNIVRVRPRKLFKIGYLTNLYRDSHQKELTEWRRNVKKPHVDTIARKSSSNLPVTSESLNFAEFHGFHDFTSNFKLHFRTIGCLYLGAAWDLSSSFFELFLLALLIKVGHKPHYRRLIWSSFQRLENFQKLLGNFRLL